MGEESGTLEATRLMNQGSLVLDVRDEKDYTAGHLPKARHIPLRDLAGRLNEIGKYKEKPVIVTGTRAGAACRLLRQSGFNIGNATGAFLGGSPLTLGYS